MSLQWIEGFEVSRTKAAMERRYPGATIDSGVSFPAGRIAGSAFQGTAAQSKWKTPGLTPDSQWIIGQAVRLQNPEPGSPLLILYDGSNEQIRVEVSNLTGTGYKLTVKRGGSTIGTTASELSSGQWYYVEFGVILATSATGIAELRINESVVAGFSATSVQTANAGTTSANAVEWYADQQASGSLWQYDDIYVVNGSGATNNTYLGDSVVEGKLPNADGDSLQFTPLGGGTHYTEVDDVDAPDDDASYVQTATNNNTDLYKYPQLSVITGNIFGVQVQENWRLLASGSRNVATVHKHTTGTISQGITKAVNSTAYKEYRQIFDVNPATGTQWTLADFNTGGTPIQFGVRALA